MMEEEIEKLWYGIQEVSELLDLNPTLLRYWETEFPQIKPRKNAQGKRMYSSKDIELLRQIHYLVKIKRYTLEGARNYLEENPEQALFQTKALLTLKKIRKFLINLRDKKTES